MAFLVIAGITVPVAIGGASVLAPERIGSSQRAFDGSLRTSVRLEKRGWRFRTPPRWVDDWSVLEAAVADGVAVACSGDAIGAAVSCEVTLADADLVAVPGGFRKALTLNLREI